MSPSGAGKSLQEFSLAGEAPSSTAPEAPTAELERRQQEWVPTRAIPTGLRSGNDLIPVGAERVAVQSAAAESIMQTSGSFHSDGLKARLELLGDRPSAWIEQELTDHWRIWQRLSEDTIANQHRHLRRMARHPIFPVKIHGTRTQLVDSFLRFFRHREVDERRRPGALKNDLKAIRNLGDFLGIPRELWPRAPPMPKKVRSSLPRPEQVNALLHARYAAKNSYEQLLMRSLLALDFGFGVRFPSEAFALRVQDVDLRQHTLVITEPKKRGSTRRVLIEPAWLCCGRTRASLANYLKARAKIDVGGTDALFLQPTGEPFPNKLALKRWIDRRVKPVAERLGFGQGVDRFHCYLGRTWCANARLIEWGFDYGRVADWLGHDSVDMTRNNYEQEARLHAKLYGDQWLSRAFRLRRRATKGPKKAPSPDFPSGESDGTGRI
jgi:integrase